MPLAIDGAAPMTTTKMIAFSFSPNSTSAIGNHTIDGMVCSPVTSEDDRGAQHLDARHRAPPSAVPTTTASRKPTIARVSVAGRTSERVNCPLASRCQSSPRTRPGPGGCTPASSPVHTTTCQTNRPSPMAATFGQVADQTRGPARSVVGVGQLEGIEAGELAIDVAGIDDLRSSGHGGPPPRGDWR